MTTNKIMKAIIWLGIVFVAWASFIFARNAKQYEVCSRVASNYVQTLLIREEEWISNGIGYDWRLGAAPFCDDIERFAKQSVANTGISMTLGGLAICGIMVVSTINTEDEEAD